jgi:hypothetical protein
MLGKVCLEEKQACTAAPNPDGGVSTSGKKFIALLIGRSMELGAGQAVPKWLPRVPHLYLELLPQIATQASSKISFIAPQGRSLGFPANT